MINTTIKLLTQQLQDKYGFVMTTPDVSNASKISQITLKVHRAEGTGIPYTRIGRAIRYIPQDVATYIVSQRIRTA